jgi:hypothetical protein
MTLIDDTWRGWIAENLLLGNSTPSILDTLVAHGFDDANARREIELAQQSPYVSGVSRVRDRLVKRDWILSVYGRLHQLRGQREVPRRERLGVAEFFDEYYCQNRPVIITGMMDDWPAREKWSLRYLEDACGDIDVEVQWGRDAGPDYEVNRERYIRTVRFSEFIDRIATIERSNDFYMTANNHARNAPVLKRLRGDFGRLPYLTDDDTAGFFWFGPAGTKTPLHHDLTNNFMAQVIGSKRINLFPFFDTPNVYNEHHCFSTMRGDEFDVERFPLIARTQYVQCDLNPGEVLFLPIGWWHYVEGLRTSITLTFTNFLKSNDFFDNYQTFSAV